MMTDTQSQNNDLDYDAMMKQLQETALACRKCISSVDECILFKNGDVNQMVNEQLIQKLTTLEDDLKLEKARCELAEAEKEKLTKDLDDCQKQLQEAQEFIISLTSARRPATTIEQERIDLLEKQLQIFRDDFESERREHTCDIAKISNLEQTVNLLRRQLQQQQPSAALGQMRDVRQPIEYLRENSGGGRTQAVTGHCLPSTMRSDLAEENP